MTTSSPLAERLLEPRQRALAPQGVSALVAVVAATTVTWTGVRVGSVALSDAALVAALVAVGPSALATQVRRLPLAAVVPAAVLVVADLLPGGDDAGRAGLLLGGALLAVFVLVASADEPGPGRGVLADAIVVSAMASSAVAVAAAVAGVSVQLPAVPEFVGRQVGLTAHPTHLALSGVLGLGLVVGRFRKRGVSRWSGAAVALLVGGVAVSGSRAALVAVLVVGGVAAVGQRRRRTVPWWVIVGGVSVVLAVTMWSSSVDRLFGLSAWGRASTVESDARRWEDLESAARLFASSPVFGAGSDHLQGAHNVVLQLLASGGLVLLVAVLPLGARVGRGLTQRSDAVVAAASLATVGWATFALMQNSLLERMVLLVVALAAAPTPARGHTDDAAGIVRESGRARNPGDAGGSSVPFLAAAVGVSLAGAAVFVTVSAVGDAGSGSAGAEFVVGSSEIGGSRVEQQATPDAERERLPGRTLASDFDGDGAADIGVFRPAVGGWYVDGRPTVFLGAPGDVAVPGDYDGDGAVEPAVFRDGDWFVDGETESRSVGRAGDVPVPGDFDGDGAVEPAVFRDGTWVFEGGAVRHWGAPGDVPVPGDYDGDGVVDLAVFRPSVGGWYVRGLEPRFFGAASDRPVPGDYDGDGGLELAVYRSEVGGWFVEGQPTVFLGAATDVPVPADFDGDGLTDRAVYRPEVGGWFVEGQPTAFFGEATDVPLSSAPLTSAGGG